MTKREEYEVKTERFLQPIVEENHFELVDVEYIKEAGNWYLRAYIDKEGGITVDDCEVISRRLGEWLDEKDFIADSYILEVSSPGLGRPLKKEKDFDRSIGKDVDIRLYKPLNKQKEFAGTLNAYDKETVTITLEDGAELELNRREIALIRLAFDF
ncbi:ribosome maturation factor RimP [Lacrimispora sp.]|uniref:ribosome maturation factor RimP n=1 Tax=Lacrimispora sp. TaxID=2719234 RepID=UPI0034614BEE